MFLRRMPKNMTLHTANCYLIVTDLFVQPVQIVLLANTAQETNTFKSHQLAQPYLSLPLAYYIV